MAQRPKAADKALAAIRSHGKLVRDKTWWGSWVTPDRAWPAVCGTTTINKLLEQGLIEMHGMEEVIPVAAQSRPGTEP